MGRPTSKVHSHFQYIRSTSKTNQYVCKYCEKVYSKNTSHIAKHLKDYCKKCPLRVKLSIAIKKNTKWNKFNLKQKMLRLYNDRIIIWFWHRLSESHCLYFLCSEWEKVGMRFRNKGCWKKKVRKYWRWKKTTII